jgi:hypothetical protein
MILQGYNDREIEFALQNSTLAFVEDWEDVLGYMSADDCFEEYSFDLSKRTDLFHIMQMASSAVIEKYADRIAKADQRYLDMTMPSDRPFQHVDNPDPAIHWWLFRRPQQQTEIPDDE